MQIEMKRELLYFDDYVENLASFELNLDKELEN